MPTARDAALAEDILGRQGIAVHVCATDGELARELERGAGAVLVAEEMLGPGGAYPVLAAALRRQPPWSDLAVLLLTRSGADSHAVNEAVLGLSNVTLLERPLRVVAFVSAVRAALRARARQYQILSHLRDIEQARLALAAQAQRKDEFLAMLAHELRNPLAPIRNALTVLEMDDTDPARRRTLRGMMLRQVDHMVRLVDDLLEASRLSQGKIALQRRPIDLRRALRDAVDLVGPVFSDAGCTLEVDLPDEPLPMDADAVRLAQVFSNLLNNAAKYSGGCGRVQLQARAEGGEAVVRVVDDGNGIEPALLPHVFELFTRGRHDNPQSDGLGIGLALVDALVRMHGGTVEARSDGPGQGAEFVVRLPLNAGAGREAPAYPLAPAAPVALRVVVVDDNVDAAQSLALLLNALGMDCRTAHDGPSGLAVAAEHRPHLALLDIGMAGMNGYELASRLRADPAHAGLLLAAVSGWSGERDLQRSQAAGFDHHFSKPIDMRALQEVLAEAAARLAAAQPRTA